MIFSESTENNRFQYTRCARVWWKFASFLHQNANFAPPLGQSLSSSEPFYDHSCFYYVYYYSFEKLFLKLSYHVFIIRLFTFWAIHATSGGLESKCQWISQYLKSFGFYANHRQHHHSHQPDFSQSLKTLTFVLFRNVMPSSLNPKNKSVSWGCRIGRTKINYSRHTNSTQ